MDRREFIEISGAAAGAAMFGSVPGLEAQEASPAIGIQVGAVSFLDEGTDKVLDIFAEMAGIDTLFLATFTYGRGIGGRQPRGIWPGIEIDIPTGEKEKKTTPEDVYQAVKATFDGGAHGIILSRKYSEMRLDNLRAAGRAIRESATRRIP